jgi:uncharacterized protein YbjQ (UPF0145 family)
MRLIVDHEPEPLWDSVPEVDTEWDRIMGERANQLAEFQTTSGPNFEGYAITDYLGFVSEEIAVGMGWLTGYFASLSNQWGSESRLLGVKLAHSKQTALDRLRVGAINLGANALIGVDLDYTMFSDTILAVIASGTAVRISRNTSSSPGKR